MDLVLLFLLVLLENVAMEVLLCEMVRAWFGFCKKEKFTSLKSLVGGNMGKVRYLGTLTTWPMQHCLGTGVLALKYACATT